MNEPREWEKRFEEIIFRPWSIEAKLVEIKVLIGEVEDKAYSKGLNQQINYNKEGLDGLIQEEKEKSMNEKECDHQWIAIVWARLRIYDSRDVGDRYAVETIMCTKCEMKKDI